MLQTIEKIGGAVLHIGGHECGRRFLDFPLGESVLLQISSTIEFVGFTRLQFLASHVEALKFMKAKLALSFYECVFSDEGMWLNDVKDKASLSVSFTRTRLALEVIHPLCQRSSEAGEQGNEGKFKALCIYNEKKDVVLSRDLIDFKDRLKRVLGWDIVDGNYDYKTAKDNTFYTGEDTNVLLDL